MTTIPNTTLKTIRTFMDQDGVDGWLSFDFRGSNPYPALLVNPGDGMLSRRWFVWLPREGDMQVLVHDIEAGTFPEGDYTLLTYSSQTSLGTQISRLIDGADRVAMEYSPMGNNPYISKVDGGTLDMVRSAGTEVVSSGNLCQLLLTWSPEQLDAHLRASRMLTETKDFALETLRKRSDSETAITEYELQQLMAQLMSERGFEADHPPIVGFGANAGDPHYSPARTGSRQLQTGDAILLDLYCKLPGNGPYADITWMAHCGEPDGEFSRAFSEVIKARDLGLSLLETRCASGEPVKGCEIDDVVRTHLEQAGYSGNIKHRTGHSLGVTDVHGDAAHFDAFETLDERLVLPGLAWTIEPGVYFPHFGIRSEINVYVGDAGAELTTACQSVPDIIPERRPA